MNKHWAVFIQNDSDKKEFITKLLGKDQPTIFKHLAERKGMLFSKSAVRKYIATETKHGNSRLTKAGEQRLKTMSSGEQKKALLHHILNNKPEYIILDNLFDNLDIASQNSLRKSLEQLKNTTICIQLLSRKNDLLSFIKNFAQLGSKKVTVVAELSDLVSKAHSFNGCIPKPLQKMQFDADELIRLRNISVSYLEKPIVHAINWTIKKGEFWQLSGPNGSGKSTLLSMVTGENPKGYGQDLHIFGQKKGSGESVWDIKKRIGYFTPSLTDSFRGYQVVENMLISGLYDSIGLYTKPVESQVRLANEWLALLNLSHLKDQLFHELSEGQKRLIMCARAMIKHPTLLIFDEPTAGLDDASAGLFVALVNQFANESETAIIFVSHRNEPGLTPQFVYELQESQNGSVGIVQKK